MNITAICIIIKECRVAYYIEQMDFFFFCLRLRVLSKENNGFPVFGRVLKSTTVTE